MKVIREEINLFVKHEELHQEKKTHRELKNIAINIVAFVEPILYSSDFYLILAINVLNPIVNTY